MRDEAVAAFRVISDYRHEISFLRAIDAGAEDEMLSWMAWYEEKMGAEQAALGQEETADTQNSEAGEAEGERKGEQE